MAVVPSHKIDPTFDAVFLREIRTKGYTCRSCEHWTNRGCEINRPTFPEVCRRFSYAPGVDEVTRR